MGWALAIVLFVSPGGAEDPGDPDDAALRRLPPPAGWQPVELPGVERATRYAPLEDAAGVRAVARCSASGLVLDLPADLDLAATPVLRWRWRPERLPSVTDERSRAGDDFALRVSLMFPFEPERAGVLARLRHRLAGRLVGREVPGTTLYFVWSSELAPGTRWRNPYAEAEVAMWALERGPAEEWREAAVHVPRAYRAAFGAEPPPVAALGLMTDADNGCSEARGLYADFRFGAAGASPPAAPGIEGPEPRPSPIPSASE